MKYRDYVVAARRMSALYLLSADVCLSVTFVYCVQVAKGIVKVLSRLVARHIV